MSTIPHPLVLVVGMHRSGTSLLGNLLAAAGLAMPGPLITGDEHNPSGYFERADITSIQEQLLIDLDRWWPGSTGMLPLPANWLSRPVTHDALQRMRSLLQEEQDRIQGPWVIKDPRSSLLLPLWRRLCSDLSIPLRLVLALRPPAQVIHSLCRRDAGPAGMTAQRAEELWWHHNRSVLDHSIGLPLMVVDDRRWFSADLKPREQLSQVLKFCGLEAAAQNQATIDTCLKQIRPEHRHSAVDLDSVTVHSQSLALHEALARGELKKAKALKAPNQLKQLSAISTSRRARLKRLLSINGAKKTSEEVNPQLAEFRGWFSEEFYRRCNPHLHNHPDLLQHYLKHGWQEGRQPHPLFDPSHYLQACITRGIPTPTEQSPLEHFLKLGIALDLTPTPLLHTEWWKSRGTVLDERCAPTLVDLHPWAGAALALADHDEAAASSLLGFWLREGIPAIDWESLTRPDGPWLQWPDNPALPALPVQQAHLQRSNSGLPLNDWRAQGWLASLSDLETDETETSLQKLHLMLLPPGQQPQRSELQKLCLDCDLVIADVDPKRCRSWARLGMHWTYLPKPTEITLDSFLAADPWLEKAAQELGFPDPRACPVDTLICLGSGTPEWNRAPKPGIWHLPGFDELNLEHIDIQRMLAAWLWQAHRCGLSLIRLNPLPPDPKVTWAEWLPMQWFQPFGLTPERLHSELKWREEGQPAPSAIHTPCPETIVQWHHQNQDEKPESAVIISLFNYSDRIENALSSVKEQTLKHLELIIVDDCSEDASASIAEAWLKDHGKHFQRALLLKHLSNGGLASARNTGFRHSKATWCFVLDADNQLDARAVEQCLALAKRGTERLGVVHPLIRRCVENSDGSTSVDDLLSRHSWQRERFATEGNHVDAMALVRRSAWETVGGYHHIPGGWEDFDFWCCLIDAGYHGVLYPETLATYTTHENSMLQSSTNQNLRSLSRLLQSRHPWLHLPLGNANH